MKKVILGVKIDDVSIPEVVNTVEGWLKKPGKHYIVTPNPEIVMMAQQDLELKKILNQADLAIPDGNGLKAGTDIENNSPGIDVMEELIKKANVWGSTIGLLGGRGDVAKKAAECLQKKYPNLKISFISSGGEVNNDGNVIASPAFGGTKQSQKEIASSSMNPPRNDGGVDILFVAFGPPKQEKWIAQNLPKIPVKVAMVVGGSFDYLSGRVPRAPIWMRSLGLEWLFRLLTQPWRIKRQLALLKYLFLVVWKI